MYAGDKNPLFLSRKELGFETNSRNRLLTARLTWIERSRPLRRPVPTITVVTSAKRLCMSSILLAVADGMGGLAEVSLDDAFVENNVDIGALSRIGDLTFIDLTTWR